MTSQVRHFCKSEAIDALVSLLRGWRSRKLQNLSRKYPLLLQSDYLLTFFGRSGLGNPPFHFIVKGKRHGEGKHEKIDPGRNARNSHDNGFIL